MISLWYVALHLHKIAWNALGRTLCLCSLVESMHPCQSSYNKCNWEPFHWLAKWSLRPQKIVKKIKINYAQECHWLCHVSISVKWSEKMRSRWATPMTPCSGIIFQFEREFEFSIYLSFAFTRNIRFFLFSFSSTFRWFSLHLIDFTSKRNRIRKIQSYEDTPCDEQRRHSINWKFNFHRGRHNKQHLFHILFLFLFLLRIDRWTAWRNHSIHISHVCVSLSIMAQHKCWCAFGSTRE